MKKYILSILLLTLTLSASEVMYMGMTSNCLLEVAEIKKNERITIALKNIDFFVKSKSTIRIHIGNNSFTTHMLSTEQYKEFFNSLVQCSLNK